MTSFQTDDDTREHVATLGVPEPLWFSQSVSLRLDARQAPCSSRTVGLASTRRATATSWSRSAAPGTLAALRERGVEHVAVSNVDNLGARLDPVVIGAHVLAGRADDRRGRARRKATWAARRRGSTGGSDCSRARSSRRGFDQARIRVFNTNTAMVDPRSRSTASTTSRWLYVAQDGRRPHGGAARAALPPDRVVAADDLPSRSRGEARAGGSSRSRSRRISRAPARGSGRCSRPRSSTTSWDRPRRGLPP